MLRTRRVENLRHGALTTTAGTREGSTITATASPHPAPVFSLEFADLFPEKAQRVSKRVSQRNAGKSTLFELSE